jgi:transcriptional antiterminator RfaH
LTCRFRPGDKVRILGGAFADHIGVLASLKPHERVEILLSLFGGTQKVSLAADAVERV